MKIISLNCNGLRSAISKGLIPWLKKEKAEIICLQETRIQDEHLTANGFQLKGYRYYYLNAQKKGYSGVAIYSRIEPDKVIHGFGYELSDREGRYLQLDHGKLSIISLYMPSGSSGDERQAVKYQFMDIFMDHLKSLRRKKREYIICGDWNIAHRNIDIKNWRGNRKNSGFLPKERAWLDELFERTGFIDAFRLINKKEDQYTWWSNRGRAWEKNVGWRIDYQIITPGLKDLVRSERIYKKERFSDHAPLIMKYNWNLQ